MNKSINYFFGVYMSRFERGLSNGLVEFISGVTRTAYAVAQNSAIWPVTRGLKACSIRRTISLPGDPYNGIRPGRSDACMAALRLIKGAYLHSA